MKWTSNLVLRHKSLKTGRGFQIFAECSPCRVSVLQHTNCARTIRLKGDAHHLAPSRKHIISNIRYGVRAGPIAAYSNRCVYYNCVLCLKSFEKRCECNGAPSKVTRKEMSL